MLDVSWLKFPTEAVKVGNGAVVDAQAVVAKNAPAYEIVLEIQCGLALSL